MHSERLTLIHWAWPWEYGLLSYLINRLTCPSVLSMNLALWVWPWQYYFQKDTKSYRIFNEEACHNMTEILPTQRTTKQSTKQWTCHSMHDLDLLSLTLATLNSHSWRAASAFSHSSQYSLSDFLSCFLIWSHFFSICKKKPSISKFQIKEIVYIIWYIYFLLSV